MEGRYSGGIRRSFYTLILNSNAELKLVQDGGVMDKACRWEVDRRVTSHMRHRQRSAELVDGLLFEGSYGSLSRQ